MTYRYRLIPRFPSIWLAALAFSLGLLLLSSCQTAKAQASKPSSAASTENEMLRELRGVWLTNVDSDVLESREKIAEAMELLARTNINAVYPVVWNKSMTLYPSDVMEKRFGIRIDPLYEGRDPLQDVIVEAHSRGIEVIPWFEYGFASSYNLDGGPLLEQKPEWAALDQYGDLAKKNNFEWMNALDPEVQDFLTSLILEVARNYDVDGIQGDDRLPALPSLAGYNKETVEKYRQEFGEAPPEDYKDPHWVQWRADMLTEFLADLREKVKAVDPNLIISMSPSFYDWSLREYLQDSKTWVNRGLVDIIHPQAYRKDIEDYRAIVDDFVENQFTQEQLDLLYPGILAKVGSYRVSADVLRQSISYNRKNGIGGEVLFFFEALRENDMELARMLADGPYEKEARLPYREGLWRPKGLVFEATSAEPEGVWRKDDSLEPACFFLEGNETGRMVYTVQVPVTAVYTLCVWMPERDHLASLASYTVIRPANEGASAMRLDQSAARPGWVPAGTVKLAGEKESQVVLTPLEAEPGEVTAAGRVMLLLNRKLSPDAEWMMTDSQ